MQESIWVGVIIIALYIWAETYSCIKANRQAKQKSISSGSVDGTDWQTYGSEGRIKQDRSELIESMKKWRKEA
jgi:hypothetical protein